MRVLNILPLGVPALLTSPQVSGTVWNEGLLTRVNPVDNKIYLTGTMDFAASIDASDAFAISAFRPYLARYNSDLTLDTSFGAGGISFLDDFTNTAGVPDVSDWESTSIDFDQSGRIYIAFIYYKSHTTPSPTWGYGCARFNSDGAVDNSFGTNGMFIIFPIGAQYSGQARVSIQSNGGVIVSTAYGLGGGFLGQVSRLTSSGVFDTSFHSGGGQPGTCTLSDFLFIAPSQYYGEGCIIDASDNIIFVSGIMNGLTESQFYITKVDGITGVVDISFGTSGVTKVSFPQALIASANFCMLQGSKIIVSGQAAYDASNHLGIGLTRLNSNGSLDTSFGTSGVTVTAPINLINCQPGPSGPFFDGSNIIIFGFSSSAGSQFYLPTRQGFVAKYDQDGNLVTSFGATGFLTIPFLNGDTDNSEELYSGQLYGSSGVWLFSGHLFAKQAGGTQAYLAKMVNGGLQTTYPPAGTAPSVTTNATSSIGTTTATANATINPNSNSTTWLFQYGVASGLYCFKSVSAIVGSGSSGVGVTASLTGLTSGQTYFGRAAAWSAVGGLTVDRNEVTWTQL